MTGGFPMAPMPRRLYRFPPRRTAPAWPPATRRDGRRHSMDFEAETKAYNAGLAGLPPPRLMFKYGLSGWLCGL